MDLEVCSVGDWKVVRPSETRLDAYVAEDFKKSLIDSVQDGTRKLVIDLACVEFMDSSGLGAIVCCLQRMDQGRIAIAAACEAVEMMLRLTHIDKVFTLVERPQDLLKTVEEPAR
jgi:anti-sigma B factor antagonist